MARPIDEGKRLEIAQGALQLLRTRGIHQTTMSSVADALGMKRSTLYWYFPDLRAIFAWLLGHVQQDENVFVGERLAASGVDHPIDVLIAWMEADLAFYEERSLEDFLLLVCQFWATGTEHDREAFRQLTIRHAAPIRELMTLTLAQGIADGRVKPCDPRAVVDFAATWIQGALVSTGLGHTDGAAANRFVRQHVLAPLRR